MVYLTPNSAGLAAAFARFQLSPDQINAITKSLTDGALGRVLNTVDGISFVCRDHHDQLLVGRSVEPADRQGSHASTQAPRTPVLLEA